ncbi:hypothetical protein BDK51DRAFT_51204 [Blyttiomyces helicus]|uniref:Uncharacterized protein n=1 Tax=Blyttiomyces helicus TaxID=388810 RepID=A0A4P9WBY6_9FUNG|nr:hypothetical protein BDK51DRAFT_51204 [Blyttiomyces helicus]|eukprot:RKO89145.1 hypothetical protein BDK51DRAFT_51204 [Blyttiomyces helicus]
MSAHTPAILTPIILPAPLPSLLPGVQSATSPKTPQSSPPNASSSASTTRQASTLYLQPDVDVGWTASRDMVSTTFNDWRDFLWSSALNSSMSGCNYLNRTVYATGYGPGVGLSSCDPDGFGKTEKYMVGIGLVGDAKYPHGRNITWTTTVTRAGESQDCKNAGVSGAGRRATLRGAGIPGVETKWAAAPDLVDDPWGVVVWHSTRNSSQLGCDRMVDYGGGFEAGLADRKFFGMRELGFGIGLV